MKIESIEQAKALVLGDASIAGILWQNDNCDLAIHLTTSCRAAAVLTCLWFHNLKINLDFSEMNSSLTWDVEFSRSDKGIWHIAFDFAGTPPGVLELDCNEIEYRETECEQSSRHVPK